MKKNILKLGVIGMALVFTMGLSLNAMAADTKTKVKTTKATTGITQQCKRVEPTAAEIAKMKASAAANYKKILDYFVGTGAITQTDADTAYKLLTESTERMDMSKLPASVQKALNDLRETERNFTEAQRTALRTATQEYLKTEIQKLVDTNVITSDFATSMLSMDKAQKGDKGTRVELTTTQRDALRTAEEQARKSAIEKLQAAGTITANQAAMMNLNMGGIGMGFGMNFGGKGFDGEMKLKLTDAEKAQMKATETANFKAVLSYYVGTGAVTQADADTAYKLISENSDRLDMSKLPTTVQNAMKDLRDTQKNLTETQKTALRTTVDEFFKVEVQKLVDSKVITSDIATQLLSTTKGDKTEKATLTVTQMDAIRTAHQQAEKAAIDKLKTAGTITSEQAAKLGLEGMDIRGPMGHNGHGGPDGSGNKDGMNGRGHGGPGHNNDNQLGTNSNK